MLDELGCDRCLLVLFAELSLQVLHNLCGDERAPSDQTDALDRLYELIAVQLLHLLLELGQFDPVLDDDVALSLVKVGNFTL